MKRFLSLCAVGILSLASMWSIFANPVQAQLIYTCDCNCTAFNGDPAEVTTESLSYRPSETVIAYNEGDAARGRRDCQSRCDAALSSQSPPTTGTWTSSEAELSSCSSVTAEGGTGSRTCACTGSDGSRELSSATSESGCCSECRRLEKTSLVQFGGNRVSCPAAPAATTTETGIGTGTTGPETPLRTDYSPASYGYNNPLGTSATINTVINRVVRAALGVVGAIFLAVFVYGGALWMTAGGDSGKVSKAKSALINSVIGMVIVALSYTILNVLFSVAGSLTGG